MDIKTIKTLDQINSTRAKIYYNLKALESITMLSPRALKYRMKVMKEKYKTSNFFLYKTGREWNIHYTLIIKFLPKYNTKRNNAYTENWLTEFGWNAKSNYGTDFHIQILEDLKTELNHYKIGFCLEKDKRGQYHVHGITNATKEKVKNKIDKIISKYMLKYELKTEIKGLLNKYSYVEYMRKQGEIKFL